MFKRTIPLLITALGGFVLVISTFIPAVQSAGEAAAIWFDILASIAFVLGGGNLLKLQLQAVSDRKPGWGYSLVALVAFLASLLFGLLKVGSPPEQNVEHMGESFASLPVSALPVYSVPGELTPRPDGQPLPASVRRQFRGGRADDGSPRLEFQGWLMKTPREDLLNWRQSIRWKCLVEQLADAAQPPQPLRAKLKYYVDHQALAWTGFMTDADRAALLAALPESPPASAAVARLYELARRAASIPAPNPPSGFAIPDSDKAFLSLQNGALEIHGPMTVKLRDNLAKTWCGYPFARMLTPRQRQQLISDLESRGPKLTATQQAAIETFCDGEWKAEGLILALNTAGVHEPKDKTFCELAQEVAAGDPTPDPATPGAPPTLLNARQEAAVRSFVASGVMTPAQLQQALTAAGPLEDAQQSALQDFFENLPAAASRLHDLCFHLLEQGPLSADQREFLLADARDQFRWRQSVGRLFIAAHQVKYPWSGEYSAQGSPFWWLYEYVFQPLLTTTFAVLAFYVASAAFRAFRAKNLEAVLLLGTAFLILLSQTFAGAFLTRWIPDRFSAFRIDQLKVYIMSIFATAGNRAIMMGIALGTVSMSLRVLLGIDRSYLGSGDD